MTELSVSIRVDIFGSAFKEELVMLPLRFLCSKALEERGVESGKEGKMAGKRGQGLRRPVVICKIIINGLGR